MASGGPGVVNKLDKTLMVSDSLSRTPLKRGPVIRALSRSLKNDSTVASPSQTTSSTLVRFRPCGFVVSVQTSLATRDTATSQTIRAASDYSYRFRDSHQPGSSGKKIRQGATRLVAAKCVEFESCLTNPTITSSSCPLPAPVTRR
jgi:hypothetical protein